LHHGISPESHMTNFTIGEFSVSRVEEVLGPGFQPNQLLPDWNKAAIAPHLPWLVPNYYDPENDRIISSLHSWVIRTRHHTILIDTCAGNHKDRPSMPRFHMLDRPYLANLKAAGVDPAKVDFVLCTHLHIDHVGWNTRLDNGRWVPTFPNAKYVFSKVDRDYFNGESGAGGKAGDSPKIWADSILPVIESGQAMAVEMTHKLGDGLLIEPAPGHSPGHVVLKAQSKGQEALFVGDVLHHPMQVYETGWSSAFCTDPEQARTSRRNVLAHCASHGSLLCPAHFGTPHLGRIAEKGGKFSYKAGLDV
jgi:glyoxylase-like metal-dependent hydrolase (beta-lactamase superfamily II)